jgi:signal transduction histidine kinase/DNA-binding response OmpR family regulator/HPt (histidine-containing phosphotransfer) domain-containing protein
VTTDDLPQPTPDAGRPLRVLLRRPLLVGLAALMTVALTTLGLAVLVVTVLGSRVDRANEMLSALQDSHTAMINQETGLRGFLVTREDRFLQPYRKGAADLAVLDAELARWAERDDDLAGQLAELKAAEDRWIGTWVVPLLAGQPAVGDTVALSDLLGRDKALFDRYRAVESDVRAVLESRRSRAMTQQRVVLLGGAVLGLVVAGAVAVAVRRANRRLTEELLPPTQQVRDTLAALAAGDVDRRATESGPTELRDIAGDVNTLGQALRDRGALVAAREQDLLAARDQAERAGQAKTTFLATMSHEIRTPLNAVLGLTDLLLTTELTDEQRRHLETISSSGDSLLTLINDILDFSKIEAGELDLEQAPFDLQGMVYDVAQLFAPQAAGKGLDLLVDIPGDCPWQVVGDGTRLRQVVLNLVANAIKFTAEGLVVVRVTGVAAEGRWSGRLAVSDTGIGIPEGQRDRLFRSFSQVDASTTRTYGGTGLGLAISQRIARAMGGDITVDSEAGVGSTFTVTVELGLAGEAPLAPDESLAGRRVLVVDDSPTNLRILEHQLNRFGAECVLAGGGTEALAHVDLAGPAGRFDVAVLDMHMPGMDGAELAARLRQLPAGLELPLVLLSSSATQAGAGAHFAARLHKPVRPERLVQTIRSVLRPGSAAARGARTSTAASPSRSGGPLGRELRVLVAEDHAVNAHLMGLYLEQLGHLFDHVVNGEEAVAAVAAGSYDVVLMDAQMPVLGGVDATTAIRAMPGPQPAIIAVTASVLAGDRAAFLAAGADAFLTKPVRLATLDDTLSEWTSVGEDRPTEDDTDAPAPDESPVADPPLDAETVDELRDLGTDGFEHLYRQYLGSLGDSVAALVAAAGGPVPAEDEELAVDRLAHRLKGSSAALGARRLAELCQHLEDGVAGPVADLGGTLAELEEEGRRVEAAVRTLLTAPR